MLKNKDFSTCMAERVGFELLVRSRSARSAILDLANKRLETAVEMIASGPRSANRTQSLAEVSTKRE